MKKRLLCLVLGLLMVLTVLLTGCSSSTGTMATTTKQALTITLYCIKQPGTTPEGVAGVQNAINEITETKYGTHIILKLYEESEYYAALDAKNEAIKNQIAEEEAEEKRKKEEAASLKAAGQTVASQTAASTAETAVNETIINDKGQVVTVYPEEKENQLDIFLVNDYTKFQQYVENKDVQDLSSQLSSTYKTLNKYISAPLLSAFTVDNGVYAIPNNHTIGEYTYLLVNKELATDKLYYGESDFGSLTGLETYLKDVATYYPDYLPLYNFPDATVANVVAGNTTSLLGGYITTDTTSSSRMLPKNLLSLAAYTNYLKSVYNYKAAGYVTEGDAYTLPADKKIAAAYVKGDYSLREQYADDYYVYIASMPIANQADVMAGAFCISSYTENLDRCMEIVSLFTTDSTFRNLFQYGVQDVNYKVNDDGVFVPTNTVEFAYNMNIYHTGNQFILNESSDMSDYMKALAKDDWKTAKLQNNDLIISPYVFFPLKYITPDTLDKDGNTYESIGYKYMYTADMLKGVEDISKEILDKINNFKEYVDEDGETVTFAKYLRMMRDELDNNEAFSAAIDSKNNEDSIYKQYLDWYTKTYGE